ncbi:nucleophosmin-like isoform X2 [Cebus imitator]|uniref:nucleophosmin-like isoform X2 n=1 Tax=Cebus imitator TaxID=2715852 RepID=UPI0018985556|nr:nucleophosmin-like isoform X2 [Cebus imitator]
MEDSMDMDMSPLRPRNYLFSCELKADKDDHFKPPRPAMKLLSMSGKQSAPGGGSKVPQKKVKLAADEDEDVDDEDNDDDFDVEETEEKVLVKKSKNPSQKQEKTPKTPKGPSSVEYIKANVQESIEKGGSLPKVEAKFINYVKNCFQMTDQEAI